MTYQEARTAAQAKANELGYDFGIEKNRYYQGGFSPPFMLPRRENRTGHELRCEVVSCEIDARMQVGHGYK